MTQTLSKRRLVMVVEVEGLWLDDRPFDLADNLLTAFGEHDYSTVSLLEAWWEGREQDP